MAEVIELLAGDVALVVATELVYVVHLLEYAMSAAVADSTSDCHCF